MAFDITKYRTVFLEESAEHLSEFSAALLVLEKDEGCVDAIDVIFRMVHSIKSMAASLGYDSISEVSHRLEDLMQKTRSAAFASAEDLRVLFVGLQALEEMIDVVRSTGESPSLRPELIDELTRAAASSPDQPAATCDRAIASNQAAPNQAAQEGGQAKKDVS